MAQASGKDVRDILSIPQGASSTSSAGPVAGPSSSSAPSARPPTGPPSRHRPNKKPKIDGITRELHALLGDNAPSLAVAHHDARLMLGEADGEAGAQAGPGEGGYRPKYVKRKERKPRKWKMEEFMNPARKDDLVLKHWVADDGQLEGQEDEADGTGSSSQMPRREYPFAAFNTSSGVFSYTNEEYNSYLKDEDWSKEETDHLMDLCQTYDLRFIVIADRWDHPPTAHKKRTMEDMKARYYTICRRMIRSRISIEDMQGRQQILATYHFDKNQETERKKILNRLFERTPAQLAEEEALYVELRRIEQNEAKFASDREDLLKLLGGWERIPDVSRNSIADAGAGIGRVDGVIPGTPGAMEEALNESKRMKQRRLGGPEEPETKPSVPPAPTLTAKQKAEMKQAHFDEVNCITRFDPNSVPPSRPIYPHLIGVASTSAPVAPSPNNPSSSHGVYLRSHRVLTSRQSQLNRTYQSLSELKLPVGMKLIFPTATNCEKWEGLLGAITSGLEMKKQTDRVESELRIAKNRLNALLGRSQPQQPRRPSAAGDPSSRRSISIPNSGNNLTGVIGSASSGADSFVVGRDRSVSTSTPSNQNDSIDGIHIGSPSRGRDRQTTNESVGDGVGDSRDDDDYKEAEDEDGKVGDQDDEDDDDGDDDDDDDGDEDEDETMDG
ncbi:unnamed protein product [Sympodiomycopsis kandeliae]